MVIAKKRDIWYNTIECCDLSGFLTFLADVLYLFLHTEETWITVSRFRKKGRSDEVKSCMMDDSWNSEKQYRRRSGYVIRAFMDEYLMIPVDAPGADDSKMAVLSPVAEFIWTLLGEPRTFGEILAAVTDEFEVTAEVAEPDIRDFLRELEEHHFLLKEDEQS